MRYPVVGFVPIGDLQLEFVYCRWEQIPLTSIGWGAEVLAIADAMVMLFIMVIADYFAWFRVLGSRRIRNNFCQYLQNIAKIPLC